MYSRSLNGFIFFLKINNVNKFYFLFIFKPFVLYFFSTVKFCYLLFIVFVERFFWADHGMILLMN